MSATTSDRIVAAMIANLSEEGLAYGRLCEYRQGYPKATEAEIQMLVDAENKAGYPPRNLAHAKTILSDNVWVFTPYGRAKSLGRHDFEPPAFKPWAAFHYWRPSGQPRSL